MTSYHVVPINIIHIYIPNNFALLYYSATRGTFSKNLQRGTILLFRMELTWHGTMWCLSILSTLTYPTIFTLVYYSTTRGTFSKNLQRGIILLFRMKLTWHGTMWCLSILYTFIYLTILHWSIILPPEGLLGKIVFKYPIISTLPIIHAEGILLNICHIINVYWDPILQEIMS